VNLCALAVFRRAKTEGGGIKNIYAGIITMNGDSISGNKAYGSGGGIFNAGTTTIKERSSIFLNIADSDANGVGNGGGIFKDIISYPLVFQDRYGNPTNDPAVIDSIVHDNHLQSDTGTPSNIEPIEP
jgi:hypothetical protein